MAQIIWTAPALSDLNDIAEYISLDKPNAARRLVKQVISTLNSFQNQAEYRRS